jgi:hypothetical protein
LYGWDSLIEHVRIRNSDDVGLWSEWGSSPSDPGPIGMETMMNDVKVGYCNGDGIVWRGPHDAKWHGVVALENAGIGINLLPDGGALMAVGCHSWGNAQTVPWYVGAHLMAVNCQAEGGSGAAQVVLAAQSIQWIGGQVFAAGGTAVGFQLGDGVALANCLVRADVLNCTTGAINYVDDGGGNLIDLVVYQTSGTTIAGTRNAGTTQLIRGSGTATSSFIIANGEFVSGGTGQFFGRLVTLASAAGGSGFNLPPGVAPTAPADGDVWVTAAGIFVRAGGVTVGPLS